MKTNHNKRFKLIIKNLTYKHSIKVIGKRFTERGTAYVEEREIVIPHIRNVYDFLICLHEIGHVVNEWSYNKMTIHRCEFLTEKWTIRQAKKYKIDKLYPKQYQRYLINAKRYVVRCCQEQKKDIPSYITIWIQSKPSIEHEF